MDAPGFVIGNIAKGKDLWDRADEIGTIWKALETSSVLLNAPRRFGKTSIMYRLYEEPRDGCLVFFEDTEGIKTPEDFISRIMSQALSELRIRSALKAATGWIGNILSRIEEIGVADFRLKIRGGVESNWQDKGLELISLLKTFDGRIVFILDELPVLIENIARNQGPATAIDFLQWFRAVRQMPEPAGMRWVVGGSIGIGHVLEKIGASTKNINDFQTIPVGPFNEKDGAAYIKALLKNEGKLARVPTAIIGQMHELIGAYVPYFIQILVYESLNEMRLLGQKALSEEIIVAAYEKEVLGPASRTYFDHYYTRLKDYYDGPVYAAARILILEVARLGRAKKKDLFKLFRQVSEGRLDDETFSDLMTDIENDFYVAYDPESDSYSFTTNILRDWWLRYHDLVEA